MLTIEKNIPAPPRAGGLPRLYPFDEMEVGDSFLAPNEKRSSVMAVASHKSAGGKKFSTRKVEGGYRVWRVS